MEAGKRGAEAGRSARLETRAGLAVAGAVLIGTGLRATMARGDLWLDEVWSLDLVGRVASAPAVFYGISHDNNHFLNSLWLYVLGPGRDAWTYRAPAMLLGAVSVVLAAATEWRRSRAGAVAAALFTAVALPFVVYGSEARGYAGLIAATLLAVAAFEAAFDPAEPDRPADRRARWVLGAAVGAGALCHLTMVMVLPVFGLAALMRLGPGRPLRRAVDAVIGLLGPALFCLLPAMLSVLAGIVVRGGFTLGGVSPASPETFAAGYGDALRVFLGLPMALPHPACLAVAALVVLACARQLDGLRRAELLAATALLPAAMLAMRLPNLAMARYYLIPGLVLLLGIARTVGALWDGGGRGRVAAAVLVSLFVAGQALADRAALAVGRGRYGAALARMADPNGRVRYGTPAPFQVGLVAAEAARRQDLTAVLVAGDAFCATPPDWLIAVPDDASAPPPVVTTGTAACPSRFAWRERVDTNPLSGMRWDVYRRLGRGEAFGSSAARLARDHDAAELAR